MVAPNSRHSLFLKNAWEIVGKSVQNVINSTTRHLACRAGCSACCIQPIPISPLEGMAILEHVRLELPVLTRKKLLVSWMEQQSIPVQNKVCPMLLDNRCQIYNLRPFACRRFLVLDKACAPGEDPTRTRPEDMLIPDGTDLQKALLTTLPWYEEYWQPLGLSKPPRNVGDFQVYLRKHTSLIQALDWKNFFAKS